MLFSCSKNESAAGLLFFQQFIRNLIYVTELDWASFALQTNPAGEIFAVPEHYLLLGRRWAEKPQATGRY